MNYLKRGLQRVWNGIRQHKLLFLFIVLIQIAVLGVLIYLILNYPTQILQDVQGIMEPLERANYNATSIQEGAAFTPEMITIFQSYDSLVKNILGLLFWLGGIFVILQAWLWILSLRLLETNIEKPEKSWKKEIKNFFIHWLKYIGIGILFTFIPGLIAYWSLNSFFNIEAENTTFTLIGIISIFWLCCYYLQSVAFSLLSVPGRKCLVDWGRIAFKKVHQTLLVAVINFLVLGGLFVGIYFLLPLESLFPLTLILTILLLLAVVLTRILWISCLQSELKEHEKP
ncbi:MAG: hypothetical protein V2A62_03205 [Candidatus Woesearchaeota archaeon]